MFRSAFTKKDLLAVDKLSTAGEITRLGVYKVQAGETIVPGHGMLSGQSDAEGRIVIDLQDATPAKIEGMVRLHVYSAQNRPVAGGIIFEMRTETLRRGVGGTATDQTAFPIQGHQLTEDVQLVLEFIADETKTIKSTNSTVLMDINVTN